MVDFTQFFNPSAWGSWAPSASQGLTPQRQAPPPIMPSGAAQPQAPGGPPPAQNDPNRQANMMMQLGMSMMPKAPQPTPMNIGYAQPVGPGMLRGAGF